jgi:hypothetical protein
MLLPLSVSLHLQILDSLKKKEEEWSREREEWGRETQEFAKEREEWRRNAEEPKLERHMEREEAEDLKRLSEEKKQRIQQEVQDAKASARSGGVEMRAGCAFCAVLQGQEDMLDKGLTVECSLLEIVQQRFPLLGELERERNQASKQKWLQEILQLETKKACRLSDLPKPTTQASEGPELPSPSDPSCALHEPSSATPTSQLDAAAQGDEKTPSKQQNSDLQSHYMGGEGEVHNSRIAELEQELKQVKSDAELESTVAKASQRQLVAVSAKVSSLEAQLKQVCMSLPTRCCTFLTTLWSQCSTFFSKKGPYFLCSLADANKCGRSRNDSAAHPGAHWTRRG